MFTSNLISQTTWLKVKLKLVNFKRLPVFSFAIHQNIWLPDTTFLLI